MTTPPPPFTPIVNGCSLTIDLLVGDQPAQCVVGGFLTEPASVVDTTEVDRWLAAWFGNFKQNMSGGVTCQGATFRDLSVQGGATLEVGPPAAGAVGLGAGEIALSAAAALCKWTSATGGRRGKGRTFVPGVQESQVTVGGSQLSSTAQAQYLQAAQAYLAAMEPVDGIVSAAIISRADGFARQIVSVSVPTTVAIQRRRMR